MCIQRSGNWTLKSRCCTHPGLHLHKGARGRNANGHSRGSPSHEEGDGHSRGSPSAYVTGPYPRAAESPEAIVGRGSSLNCSSLHSSAPTLSSKMEGSPVIDCKNDCLCDGLSIWCKVRIEPTLVCNHQISDCYTGHAQRIMSCMVNGTKVFVWH